MTFPDLMSAIRASYAEALSAAVLACEPAWREAAMRGADGALKLDGTPPLPHRFDVLEADGDSRLVVAQRQLKFEPFEFELSGMSVSVAPFTWDWLTLAVEGDAARATQVAAEWFLHWFDAEDEQVPGDDGLHGVVHYMGDPKPVDGGVELRIDFGSAPDEVVDDLLFALAEAGMTRASLRA